MFVKLIDNEDGTFRGSVEGSFIVEESVKGEFLDPVLDFKPNYHTRYYRYVETESIESLIDKILKDYPFVMAYKIDGDNPLHARYAISIG